MLQPVNQVGQYGVVTDRAPQELPLNVWTNAQNMRFVNGSAEKIRGHVSIFGDPNVPPWHLNNLVNDTVNYWLYLGAAKAGVWDGGVHTNITRQTAGVDVDYAMSTEHGWVSTILSGVVVATNGVDAPQAWISPSPATKLVDLTNWPANTSCKSIRAFKQFLIAFDVTKTSVRYPNMIKWSHPADPNAVPTSWDETDPTLLAGESYKTAETQGFIVDGCVLRDTMMVYKEDSVWAMQLTNNLDVFRIYKVFDTGGIMSTNCAVEFFNGKHAVFGIDDIYTHDGQQMQSIVGERVRRRIFESINTDYYRMCHVVHNKKAREVYFCYPTGDNAFCTEAMVWNYENDTIGFRELPNTAHSVVGIVNEVTSTSQWAGDTQAWDDDTTRWNDRQYNPTEFQIVVASPQDDLIYQTGITNSFNGVDMLAQVERVGLPLPAVSQQPPDMTYRKFVRRLWPRIEGTRGATVYVQIGTQESDLQTVQWRTPRPFIIGESEFVDARVAGRLFAVRFFTETPTTWKVHGYEWEYERAGRY